jgi:hypothetical protein
MWEGNSATANTLHFVEPTGLLPCLQEPAINPWVRLIQPTPLHPIALRSSVLTVPVYSKWALYFGFPIKILHMFILPPPLNVTHIPPIHSSFISSPKSYFVRSSINETANYAVFSSFLSLPHSLAKISFTTPCRTPSAYVTPVLWESMFHNRIKIFQILYIIYIYLF